ncbi:expressed unknown protein [Seminavis robusta]|uniref:Uncharacterized protein n=1 Tax=Seminavis robusta TaxID=568900 RepID=A0A9N8EH54_9STRA|nr:expressed unknown protein [Seminavis robusta]|eukprot:Sro995_g229190.1 n/a (95) ;mRNA; r:26091-26375
MATGTTSRLKMGLFDGFSTGNANSGSKTTKKQSHHRIYQGMSKQEEAIRKKNTYKGPKITVRENEDAAMWIDDDNSKDQPQQTKRKSSKKGWFQ